MNVIHENPTILNNFDWTDEVCPLCLSIDAEWGQETGYFQFGLEFHGRGERSKA